MHKLVIIIFKLNFFLFILIYELHSFIRIIIKKEFCIKGNFSLGEYDSLKG